jgi:hypothetical protein
MADQPPVDLRVDTRAALAALTEAVRAEEDGKALRKELAQSLRDVLKPAAAEAKGAIMAMSSSGPGSPAPALRSSVARKIRPEVKLGGRWSGARVKAGKLAPGVRGFRNAPKRTNRAAGWRHLTFGRPDSWVTQHGRTGWFDHAFEGQEARYRAAVHQAMEAMAARLAARARSRS